MEIYEYHAPGTTQSTTTTAKKMESRARGRNLCRSPFVPTFRRGPQNVPTGARHVGSHGASPQQGVPGSQTPQSTWPIQSHSNYLKHLSKCLFCTWRGLPEAPSCLPHPFTATCFSDTSPNRLPLRLQTKLPSRLSASRASMASLAQENPAPWLSSLA